MIVSCPECNGKVSSTVPNCPHCGFKMSPPDPDSVEGLEAGSDRVACPYCAEPIQLEATICPHCRGPVRDGHAIHPSHLRKPAPPPPAKSFTMYAVVCALLYLLCWPLSFILNIIWFQEAGEIERKTGETPDGKGCLFATLVVGVILIGLFCISLFARVR